MSILAENLKADIAENGPMRVDRFMARAIGHYYSTRDPFGRAGDFVTAPEVSQMFGEMIGMWAADTWMKLGSPERFILLECGPGRGTLMEDLLRGTQHVPGFHEALELHLLEISPVLKAVQAERLDAAWHESLETVPDDAPIIVIANEFFDALPIRQVIYQNGEWRERVLDETLNWKTNGGTMIIVPPLQTRAGDIFEFSPAREGFIKDLAARLKAQTGAALIIDYGHMKSGFGDTLQGVAQHGYVDILENVGEVDLTSHVDFEALSQACPHHEITTQGDFLKALGIETRAEILAKKDPSVIKDLHRLVNPREMGTLFKVMGVCDGITEKLAGF